MSSEWISIPASEFCLSVRDGTHDSPKEVLSGGKNLVTSRHIKGGLLDLSTSYKISDSDCEEINKRSKVDQWDILFSMIGTVGEVLLVKEPPDFAIKNVGLFKSKDETTGKWLYYYLQSPNAKEEIYMSMRGSTQQYIPLGALRSFPIRHPQSTGEMREITNILGTLDDKIELNRKTNETLEAMAKALFKSWFVDFDPVRAPAEISDLFPDSFEDSELGEIPSGWIVGKIRDLIEKTGMGPFGSRMKTETFQKSGVPIIKGGNLKGMLVEGCGHDYLSSEHAAELKSSCVRACDIVITHRGTLGQVSMVPLEGSVGEYIVSQSQFYLRPASIAAGIYLLFFFHSPAGQNRLLENSSGVGVPSLARPSTLTPEIDVLLPPYPLLDLFAKQAAVIQKTFLSKQDEMDTLCSLRDALLPKLISGEIRIPDAEKMLEEVGI